jgi:heme/copper-type cytochrome/quinol oxidase subunit 1
MFVGMAIFFWNIYKTLKKPRTVVANPWDAWTLEWSTPSPPELKNFDKIPQVHSRRPLWDLNNPDNPDKKLN